MLAFFFFREMGKFFVHLEKYFLGEYFGIPNGSYPVIHVIKNNIQIAIIKDTIRLRIPLYGA